MSLLDCLYKEGYLESENCKAKTNALMPEVGSVRTIQNVCPGKPAGSVNQALGHYRRGSELKPLWPISAVGFSFASQTTVVSTPINAPSAVLNDNDLRLKLNNNFASVVGSALTGIAQ